MLLDLEGSQSFLVAVYWVKYKILKRFWRSYSNHQTSYDLIINNIDPLVYTEITHWHWCVKNAYHVV